MYLLDAGAHYSCGTTDTTRTIHCGEPSEFEKECYTLVLQAMNFKNIFITIYVYGLLVVRESRKWLNIKKHVIFFENSSKVT